MENKTEPIKAIFHDYIDVDKFSDKPFFELAKDLEIDLLKKKIEKLENSEYINKQKLSDLRIEYLILKMDRLTDNINELIKKIDNK